MGSEKRGEIIRKKVSGLRLFAGIVIGLVVTAVAAGLYLSGSPGKERSRQFDTRRLNDLQQIAGAVDAFYGRNYRLPSDLDVLVSDGGKESYLVGSLNDPQPDRGGYEYNPVGETTYELCAVFDLPSEKADAQNLRQPMPAREPVPPAEPPQLVTAPTVKGQWRTWEHDAGRFCFLLDATYAMSSVTCGLTNPCAAGQTCAALPKNLGTKCVPQGHECEAAQCPGRCTLAESYPVQVSCPETETQISGCRLMKDKKTGEVDCFGCAGGTCKNPPSAAWEEYAMPQDPGYIGIPYACFETGSGCELAQ